MNIFDAAFLGNVERVREYIQEERDLNIQNEQGDTPIHRAVMGVAFARDVVIGEGDRAREGLRELIAAGANLNMRNRVGQCAPLHIAASYNRLDVVHMLIAGNADIHIRDQFGNTPLHIAALINNVDIFRELTEAGANLDIQNDRGEIPLEIAEKKNNQNIINFINQFNKSKLIKIRQRLNLAKGLHGSSTLDHLRGGIPTWSHQLNIPTIIPREVLQRLDLEKSREDELARESQNLMDEACRVQEERLKQLCKDDMEPEPEPEPELKSERTKGKKKTKRKTSRGGCDRRGGGKKPIDLSKKLTPQAIQGL